MLQMAKVHDKVPKSIKKYYEVLLHTTKYVKVLQCITKFYKALRSTTPYCKVLQGTSTFRETERLKTGAHQKFGLSIALVGGPARIL